MLHSPIPSTIIHTMHDETGTDTGGDDIPSDPEHGNNISSQSEPLRSTKLPRALKALQSHNKLGLKESTEHPPMRGTIH